MCTDCNAVLVSNGYQQLVASEGLRLTGTGPAIDLAALLDLPAYTVDPGVHSLS